MYVIKTHFNGIVQYLRDDDKLTFDIHKAEKFKYEHDAWQRIEFPRSFGRENPSFSFEATSFLECLYPDRDFTALPCPESAVCTDDYFG